MPPPLPFIQLNVILLHLLHVCLALWQAAVQYLPPGTAKAQGPATRSCILLVPAATVPTPCITSSHLSTGPEIKILCGVVLNLVGGGSTVHLQQL